MNQIADDRMTPDESDRLWRNLQKHKVRDFLSPNFPTIVTLCGSTRFGDAFRDALREETLAGRIVLSVGLLGHAEGIDMDGPVKVMLDELHKRKIDLSDEVFILNVLRPWCPKCEMFCMEPYIDNLTPCCAGEVRRKGYIGSSTRSELEYARANGKVVRFLNQE